jgi:hypothetical protein
MSIIKKNQMRYYFRGHGKLLPSERKGQGGFTLTRAGKEMSELRHRIREIESSPLNDSHNDQHLKDRTERC